VKYKITYYRYYDNYYIQIDGGEYQGYIAVSHSQTYTLVKKGHNRKDHYRTIRIESQIFGKAHQKIKNQIKQLFKNHGDTGRTRLFYST